LLLVVVLVVTLRIDLVILQVAEVLVDYYLDLN
jgi:hypothetical protein